MDENGRRQEPAAAFWVVLLTEETTSISEAAISEAAEGATQEAVPYLPKYCARFLSKSAAALSFRALSLVVS